MVELQVISAKERSGLEGREIAASEWLEVTQEAINRFARATGEHQWIHVDGKRARRESSFGAPIVHGFLPLSRPSKVCGDTSEVSRRPMGVNYGCNGLRFTAAVTVASRIRARLHPQELTALEGGTRLTRDVTMEQEGATKPCLVAEWLTRRYG